MIPMRYWLSKHRGGKTSDRHGFLELGSRADGVLLGDGLRQPRGNSSNPTGNLWTGKRIAAARFTVPFIFLSSIFLSHAFLRESGTD